MNTARELTSRLVDLLRREHAAMADFLVALADFDRRRMWESLGYSSLFSFLRRELRLSAGAAQYRKTAAELVQRYPGVEAALRSGDLCLSSVIELAKVLTTENAGEVLPRFLGLSRREAAFVAASIRPVENPPVREFIVTSARGDAPALPVAASDAVSPPRPSSQDAVPFRPAELNAPAGDVPPPAPARVAPAPPAMTVEPLDAELARVHMTVSRRLLEKLEAARDALSHSHPGASRDEIIEAGLDLLLERAAKRRGLVKRPRKKAAAPAEAAPAAGSSANGARRSRYIPAEVRRAVWERDKGKCQWPIEGGGICGSTYQVEIDHVDGFALGGETSVKRCRLLCRPHQDVHAREQYGDDLMNKDTKPKGPTCSEPVAVYSARWSPTGAGTRSPSGGRPPPTRRRSRPCTSAPGGGRTTACSRRNSWRAFPRNSARRCGANRSPVRARRAMLWVLGTNELARGFYERHGWLADGATKRETLSGVELVEVRYVLAL